MGITINLTASGCPDQVVLGRALEIPDSGWKHIVNLTKKECDCGSFYEYQSPCAHGIATAKYPAEHPLGFFYDVYST